MDHNFCTQLRQSISELRQRGLTQASKFSAEQLNAIPLAHRLRLPANPIASSSSLASALPVFSTSTPSRPTVSDSRKGIRGRTSLSVLSPSEFIPTSVGGAFDGDGDVDFGLFPPHERPTELGSLNKGTFADPREEDIFELAHCYFEAKELDRCAFVLAGARSAKSEFLRLYATYLSADKRLQEGLPTVMTPEDDRHRLAPSFQPILDELKDADDPFLIYLKGLILFRIHRRIEAAEWFIESLKRYPFNWSCCLSLARCIDSEENLDQIIQILNEQQPHPFFDLLEIHTRIELHCATELVGHALDQLEQDVFSIGLTDEGRRNKKVWVWGESMRGMVAYQLRDFESAERTFDNMQALDPFRLDDIDIYSNMLYVIPKLTKLAQLAKTYASVDRNRAETCCLIGNFYSSRGDRPKAIQYFKRSLQLNRDYLPAWTLMGHEFVEMKNSHAAIEAYRRAVDVNPRDYRAWYGLGQTYELLDMPQYAIQYYNKATALRPYDPRMWTALAQVYENTNRPKEAIQCHERALLGNDPAISIPNTLLTLSNLHVSLGHLDEAAKVHRRLLAYGIAEGEEEGEAGEEVGRRRSASVGVLVQSWLFLAKYELAGIERKEEGVQEGSDEEGRREGNWGLAARYLENIIIHNVMERDEAERLLKQISDHQAQSYHV
ncbi:Anaphase-promoting complex (APC), Cdc23 subunit [Phaffia rhodozyma]|uniref:Anaphase-promoting complex (APC), Cdc23 subunit n=1 Tax=Phaffia rhodozyma TaxID=264483 RepID=A0A0F7SPK5_PHARH|nr:Anaphase-promoting complex (APC), Cdc23 subunit [Phaffia rhodozyma]